VDSRAFGVEIEIGEGQPGKLSTPGTGRERKSIGQRTLLAAKFEPLARLRLQLGFQLARALPATDHLDVCDWAPARRVDEPCGLVQRERTSFAVSLRVVVRLEARERIRGQPSSLHRPVGEADRGYAIRIDRSRGERRVELRRVLLRRSRLGQAVEPPRERAAIQVTETSEVAGRRDRGELPSHVAKVTRAAPLRLKMRVVRLEMFRERLRCVIGDAVLFPSDNTSADSLFAVLEVPKDR